MRTHASYAKSANLFKPHAKIKATKRRERLAPKMQAFIKPYFPACFSNFFTVLINSGRRDKSASMRPHSRRGRIG